MSTLWECSEQDAAVVLKYSVTTWQGCHTSHVHSPCISQPVFLAFDVIKFRSQWWRHDVVIKSHSPQWQHPVIVCAHTDKFLQFFLCRCTQSVCIYIRICGYHVISDQSMHKTHDIDFAGSWLHDVNDINASQSIILFTLYNTLQFPRATSPRHNTVAAVTSPHVNNIRTLLPIVAATTAWHT